MITRHLISHSSSNDGFDLLIWIHQQAPGKISDEHDFHDVRFVPRSRQKVDISSRRTLASSLMASLILFRLDDEGVVDIKGALSALDSCCARVALGWAYLASIKQSSSISTGLADRDRDREWGEEAVSHHYHKDGASGGRRGRSQNAPA